MNADNPPATRNGDNDTSLLHARPFTRYRAKQTDRKKELRSQKLRNPAANTGNRENVKLAELKAT